MLVLTLKTPLKIPLSEFFQSVWLFEFQIILLELIGIYQYTLLIVIFSKAKIWPSHSNISPLPLFLTLSHVTSCPFLLLLSISFGFPHMYHTSKRSLLFSLHRCSSLSVNLSQSISFSHENKYHPYNSSCNLCFLLLYFLL